MRALHHRSTVFLLTFIPGALLCSLQAGAASTREISPQVQVHSGGFRLDHSSNEFVQRIRVRNTSPDAITGRLILVVDQLPAEVAVANADAALTKNLPASFGGHAVALGAASRALGAGESVEFTVHFRNPSRQPIRYQPRVMLETP